MTAAPHSLVRGWQEPSAAIESQLYRGFPKPVSSIYVSSIKTKRPLLIKLDGEPVHTVADVKASFRKALALTSRKAIIIRWLGAEIEDHKTLSQCKVPDGATLDAAFRSRSNAELEVLKKINHVLVADQDGNVSVQEASGSLQISALKQQCKHVPEMPYYFSPHYTSAFGTPLDDERTLSSYHVLDGDVLFCLTRTGVPPPTAAAPPKKKK